MASCPRIGLEHLVAEQLSAAEARAVEDQSFPQGCDVCRCREAPYFDLAAGELNVARHLAKVAARFDVHRVVAEYAVERERMLRRREHAVQRREVGDDLRFRAVGLDIGWKPADSVIVADHDLDSAASCNRARG